MQEFLADFFYRHPVELEDVTNGELLGTILNANLRALSFQQPAASFQFRPFRSAGTEAHKLSAAAARRCLASRYSFPDQQARSDGQQLVKSYLEYDYPATKLLPFFLQVLFSTLPPGQLQLLAQPAAAEPAHHRGGDSRSRTEGAHKGLAGPAGCVAPKKEGRPRRPPAWFHPPAWVPPLRATHNPQDALSRLQGARPKARSPPRHSDREEDQGEPRTSAGPPTTEPTAGGQPGSQEASSDTTQRVDEEFLHQF